MRLENGREEVVRDAQRWAKEGGSLFLYGRPGPGKTRLAATAFTEALRLRSGAWVNVPTLFTQASADFRSDDRQRAERILLGEGMIVLDDLGKEATSEQNKQWLMTAIENRIENLVPILITSNFTAAELGAKWGDWLASRLGATTMRQWNLPGPDMRIEDI
jgi:DNA replication protein DnaC